MLFPLQNISLLFPCLTKDCITRKLRGSPWKPNLISRSLGTWAQQTPQEPGQGRLGLGGLDTLFLERRYPNP